MSKKRILIIDDEAGFTKLVKLNLEDQGVYEVRTENMGSQGLAAARAFRPDLILLDVVMPDADGAQLASEFKEDLDLKDIPIIFLTAVVSREEVSEQQGLIGGQIFIAKPASPEELISMIQRELGEQAGAG
ncbi:MAG: response regulator [Candidatus Omnitrophica bacterium]|nr:response regulator [Candidatus Omnitrophota bacterium]